MKNSPTYSFIKERLEREFALLDKDKLTPWVFLNTEQGLEITALDGRRIRYSGICFEGSPREVFWGSFTPPLLKDIIARNFAETRSFCKEHNIEGEIPLEETASLLRAGVEKAFLRMVEIDRVLRGNGYPNSVEPYNPTNEKVQTFSFLDERFLAEKILLPKPQSGLDKFYKERKGWVWAIATTIALLGIAASLL